MSKHMGMLRAAGAVLLSLWLSRPASPEDRPNEDERADLVCRAMTDVDFLDVLSRQAVPIEELGLSAVVSNLSENDDSAMDCSFEEQFRKMSLGVNFGAEMVSIERWDFPSKVIQERILEEWQTPSSPCEPPDFCPASPYDRGLVLRGLTTYVARYYR